ncbi:MAG: Na/Pi symporter [Chromatiales bacterium]|jgi:phosphate:Na+ symporter
MTQVIVQTLGGLGLFLLGMAVMTDGLRHISGRLLHDTLTRFTHSPLSGVLTGAGSTAILQSSSATTVAAVGFVSAGLLGFDQALGIIFGANLGTTVTGWLVAVLGFKLKLGSIVLPLIFIGALLHLFSRKKTAAIGYALAGFGLIFVGIDQLQQGMSGLEGRLTPDSFPPDNLAGRLQLVLLGIAITLITQSSSAGVATAMSALYAGAISFPQAAAMVIGMDVGTTVTAAIATLGGSVETRRTGYSHVIYNLFTAIGALLLLTPFIWLWQTVAPGLLQQQAEIALVAFHSTFNLLGVLLVLPVTRQCARLMQRLVPTPPIPMLDRLDRNLLHEPAVALTAVGVTLHEATLHLFGYLDQLTRHGIQDNAELRQLAQILDQTHSYADRIHVRPDDRQGWQMLTAAVHTLDHLQRLHERCEEEPERALALKHSPALQAKQQAAVDNLEDIMALIRQEDWRQAEALASVNASSLEAAAEDIRRAALDDIALGVTDVPQGTDRLEAIRWLRRSNYHVWRICHHLQAFAQAEQKTAQ